MIAPGPRDTPENRERWIKQIEAWDDDSMLVGSKEDAIALLRDPNTKIETVKVEVEDD